MNPRDQWQALSGYFTPASLVEDPEAVRRARLVAGFALVGSIFGPSYAVFYLLIGHVWGAGIIMVCTLGMAVVPWILKRTGNLALAGNLHAFILAAGFSGLTAIEGGVHGHAIAWLASVPLCVLLLVGPRSALVWCGICTLVTLLFCGLDSLNITTPILYPVRWHGAVTTAGFFGLVIFMSVIGVIFEIGRKSAIGKLQEALRDLSHSNAQLIELNAEKSEILGIAAHDLKNPLNEIMGFARLILQGETATLDQVKEDVGEIFNTSTHMYHLLSDLLDMQAIEEGRFFLKKEMFDLGNQVALAVTGHRPMANRKQIKLDYQGPPDSAVVRADPGATLQVVNNLISNAIKFSPRGREVTVRVRVEDGKSVVEVRDQGPGISAEDREHLFEKFARLSARPTGGEPSTGLGLSIVKHLMDRMGGTIECRSEPGEGAAFIMRFASVPPTDIMEAAERTEPGAANGAKGVSSLP